MARAEREAEAAFRDGFQRSLKGNLWRKLPTGESVKVFDRG
jgi:hypothetical protein